MSCAAAPSFKSSSSFSPAFWLSRRKRARILSSTAKFLMSSKPWSQSVTPDSASSAAWRKAVCARWERFSMSLGIYSGVVSSAMVSSATRQSSKNSAPLTSTILKAISQNSGSIQNRRARMASASPVYFAAYSPCVRPLKAT